MKVSGYVNDLNTPVLIRFGICLLERCVLSLYLNECFFPNATGYFSLLCVYVRVTPGIGSGSCLQRPHCKQSDYFYTHTACDSKSQVRQKRHFCLHVLLVRKHKQKQPVYVITIKFWYKGLLSDSLINCLHLFSGVSRHSLCLSGSSPRSAARVQMGRSNSQPQVRWWPARPAIQDSSPATPPPVNPAHMASIQMEQVTTHKRYKCTFY